MKYIVKFQKDNGLVADGIIGKRTIEKMKQIFNISSRSGIAHFLGQVAEETGNFKYGVENLNYSASGLRKIFNRYFTYQQSFEFARKPKLIANRVYDDRGLRKNKLGNIYDDDGWKFIGRGASQLTGRDNYEAFAKFMGDSEIINNPKIVATKYYWETALYVFNRDHIWKYTDSISIRNIKKVTRLINGGYNGLAHRIELTKHFYFLAK